MKRFPHYQQHDQMDCGPTCLRMIAAFYGKHYSLERLREKSFITRLGVSMLGISEAAEKIGFRTMGVQISFQQLLEDAPLPCIVHWNQQHFVVVYRMSKGQVWVADPGAGKVKYAQEEFCNCWQSNKKEGKATGIALLLEPTPDFYAVEEEDTIDYQGLGFLFSYLRPYKQLLGQLLLGLLLGSLIQLLLPFLTQSIVDFGISNQNLNYVYLVLLAQLMLTFSSSTVNFIRGWILLHLGTRINISLISDFLSKLMKLSMGYFDTKMTGDILQRINDHARIQSFLTGSSLNILFSMFNILIFGIVLALYSGTIFLIFIIGSLVYIIYVWLFLKKRAELDHKRFAQQSANQSSVVQLVTGMQEIKLSACEQQKRWEWERVQMRLFRISVKGLTIGQFQQSGSVFFSQSTNILITFIAARNVIHGDMTLGMMMSLTYIIGQLSAPINDFISFIQAVQDAKISLERLNEIHSQPDEDTDLDDKVSELPEDRTIRVEHVTFSYDGAERNYALNDVSLEIPERKVTAIVGESGCGKTTLIKLLQGFYQPNHGSIKVGNVPLTSINPHFWRSVTGSVMQESFIFSDTFAHNIALDSDSLDETRLYQAAKMANVDGFIRTLPLGYHTKIGMEGNGVSQGQRQRLLIARAIYKNPEYIFFDEATNALDTTNESEIMHHLYDFYNGRTVVVAAHRLSTVKNADQILVMRHGVIVECGTHQELLAKKGYYYELVKNQL